MKTSRFAEAQIIGVLREQEAGGTTDEVCRRQLVADAESRAGSGELNRGYEWIVRATSA